MVDGTAVKDSGMHSGALLQVFHCKPSRVELQQKLAIGVGSPSVWYEESFEPVVTYTTER